MASDPKGIAILIGPLIGCASLLWCDGECHLLNDAISGFYATEAAEGRGRSSRGDPESRASTIEEEAVGAAMLGHLKMSYTHPWL